MGYPNQVMLYSNLVAPRNALCPWVTIHRKLKRWAPWISQVRGLGLPPDLLKYSMACNLVWHVYQGEFVDEYKMTGYLWQGYQQNEHNRENETIKASDFLLNFQQEIRG